MAPVAPVIVVRLGSPRERYPLLCLSSLLPSPSIECLQGNCLCCPTLLYSGRLCYSIQQFISLLFFLFPQAQVILFLPLPEHVTKADFLFSIQAHEEYPKQIPSKGSRPQALPFQEVPSGEVLDHYPTLLALRTP